MKEKQAAYRSMGESTLGQATAGNIGLDPRGLDEPCRASLRDRVSMDLRRAQRETQRGMQLAELNHLLEKNPEVARILDLLDVMRDR